MLLAASRLPRRARAIIVLALIGAVFVLAVGLFIHSATLQDAAAKNPRRPVARPYVAPLVSSAVLCHRFQANLPTVAGAIIAHVRCSSAPDAYHIRAVIRDAAWEAFDYDERLGLAHALFADCLKSGGILARPDDCTLSLRGEQGEHLGGANPLYGVYARRPR